MFHVNEARQLPQSSHLHNVSLLHVPDLHPMATLKQLTNSMSSTNIHMEDTILIPNTTVHIPRLGLGVYKIRSDACAQACLTALNRGYRAIDSAQLYRNEAAVGTAVKESSLKRADVFLTTKASRAQATVEDTYSKLLQSIEKIGGSGGYVDLFLIHIPGSDRANRERLWAALEKLYAEAKARAIGVSNFHIHHIEEMRGYAQIWPPHANQIEVRAFTLIFQ
jgi:diketogulonate reductase-like aldo/keto reductase